jgi:DNA-binding GntR family transcriptional regulator
VIFGVFGRDQNIVRMQQTRVRGAVTLDQSLKEFDNLAAPVFLSYELLHLYGHKYLESIGRQLNFPIAVNDPRITAILADDTNAKYFGAVGAQPTDRLAQHASRKHT